MKNACNRNSAGDGELVQRSADHGHDVILAVVDIVNPRTLEHAGLKTGEPTRGASARPAISQSNLDKLLPVGWIAASKTDIGGPGALGRFEQRRVASRITTLLKGSVSVFSELGAILDHSFHIWVRSPLCAR